MPIIFKTGYAVMTVSFSIPESVMTVSFSISESVVTALLLIREGAKHTLARASWGCFFFALLRQQQRP